MGDAADVDERQVVDGELPCFDCQYDLRGQPLGGVCPECGTPIIEATRADRWDRWPIWFRRRVTWGVALLPGELAVLIGAIVAATLIQSSWDYTTELVLVSVTLVGTVGIWLATSARPGESRWNGWCRWTARCLAVAQWLPLLGMAVVRWTDIDRQIGWLSRGLPLEVVMGMGWIALVGPRHGAEIFYLGRDILSRVPGRPLRRASRWAWAVPVIGWTAMTMPAILEALVDDAVAITTGLLCLWGGGVLVTVAYGAAAWWVLRRGAGK